MGVLLYHGAALAAYGFGGGHPFGCDRLDAFFQETQRLGLDRRVVLREPVACTEADLRRFHTVDYIARVQRQSPTGSGYLDYGDTPAFRGVFEAAGAIVGSDLDALEIVMQGEHRRAFVPIAGLHHARRDTAAGFCVFNDVGVLMATLRERYAVKRILYVDIDAHHGDGVFYAFENDADVFIADIHEDGRFLYPGTGFAGESGQGDAAGTKRNLPMKPGADDAAFGQVWPQVEELAHAAKPEIIVLQAGADSIAGDPLTHMAFSPASHAHATSRLCRLAEEYCDGRLIAMGGGGYNRRNLAMTWNAVLQAMLD